MDKKPMVIEGHDLTPKQLVAESAKVADVYAKAVTVAELLNILVAPEDVNVVDACLFASGIAQLLKEDVATFVPTFLAAYGGQE